MDQRQVLVVGAGPTGLLLALELARYGVRVDVIDKAPVQPRWQSRALAVHARSMEIFYSLGLDVPFLRHGIKGSGLKVSLQGQDIVSIDPKYIPSPFNFVLILPQNETQDILDAECRKFGVNVVRGILLEHLSFDADKHKAIVTLSRVAEDAKGAQAPVFTPGKRAYDWVVGCDGGRSTVRQLAKIDFPGEPYPGRMYIADASITGPHSFLSGREIRIFARTNGPPVAAIPLPEPGKFRFILPALDEKSDTLAALEGTSEKEQDGSYVHRPILTPQQQQAKEAAILAAIEKNLAYASQQPVTLTNTSWVSDFRVQKRLAEHYMAPEMHVLLAGDACHLHSPAGGQGMNGGVQDSHNLAWKLALVLHGYASPKLLTTYEQERRPVAEAILEVTDKMMIPMMRMSRSPSTISRISQTITSWIVKFLGLFMPILTVLFSLGLYAAAFVPTVSKVGTVLGRISQVAYNYRKSPLSVGTSSTQAYLLFLFTTAIRYFLPPWLAGRVLKLIKSKPISLQAGDRAPAALFSTADGKAVHAWDFTDDRRLSQQPSTPHFSAFLFLGRNKITNDLRMVVQTLLSEGNTCRRGGYVRLAIVRPGGTIVNILEHPASCLAQQSQDLKALGLSVLPKPQVTTVSDNPGTPANVHQGAMEASVALTQEAAGVRWLLDPQDKAASTYEVDGGLALFVLRPDGHIGLRADNELSATGVQDFFQRVRARSLPLNGNAKQPAATASSAANVDGNAKKEL